MLNRRMRGFGTILFNMVPKGSSVKPYARTRFGTILFNMVPKVGGFPFSLFRDFGTILFVTGQKLSISKGRKYD